MMPTAILTSGSFSLFDKLNNFLGHIADPILDNCFGTQQLESINKVINLNASFTSSLWGIVTNALAIVKPFGIALIVTYFLMYMFDAAAKEQITVDSLIKVLIQLVLVVALISNLESIINAVVGIGNSIASAVSGGFGHSDSDPLDHSTGKEIVDGWLENDSGASILIQSVLIWLIHQIAIIAIDFAAISRLLELGWRIALAPIGVANCFEGGASSPAIKYLKGILAVALSGAAIYIVAEAGFALSAGFLPARDVDGEEIKGALFLAQAAMLATAGAAIGISAKLKEVVS